MSRINISYKDYRKLSKFLDDVDAKGYQIEWCNGKLTLNAIKKNNKS